MLANYAELQQVVKDYLEQDDISGMTQTFIRLAEARLDRELSVRWMESLYETDIDTNQVVLPPDFIEARSVYIASTTPWTLAQYRPQHLFFSSTVSNRSGIPRFYTVIGTSMYFTPDPTGVAAGTYPLKLYYRKQIPKLSTSNTTNWLLSLAPDVYLYATLLEAQPYLIDDERLSTWAQMYQQAKGSLVSLDARARSRPVGAARPRAGYSDATSRY